MTPSKKRKVDGIGRRVPINTIGARGASGGPSEPEQKKHVGVVMEITCGSWYSRHYHYQMSVVEVKADTPLEKIQEGAEKACELMSKLSGQKMRVLDVQKVEIGTSEKVKAIAEEFLSNK